MRTNIQASNLIETVAIRNIVKRTFNVQDHLQGIQPPPYSANSYRDHPETSSQLWEPFEFQSFDNASLGDTFEGVTIRKIKKALTNFYRRLRSQPGLILPNGSLEFTVAHRALINTIEVPCERHRRKIREYRRGNHHIMFNSHFRTSANSEPTPRWFVGTVLFFFEHRYLDTVEFLAFVEVMKVHTTAIHDKSIPVIYMNQSREQQLAAGSERVIDSKYAVIKLDDILLQVGLVQSIGEDQKFSVIGNYHVFQQDMSLDCGDIRHL